MSRHWDLFSCYDSLLIFRQIFLHCFHIILSFIKEIVSSNLLVCFMVCAAHSITIYLFLFFFFPLSSLLYIVIKMKSLHNPICCSTYPSGERNQHLIMKQTDSKFIYNFLFMIFINVLNHSNRYFIHEKCVCTSKCQYSRNIWIKREKEREEEIFFVVVIAIFVWLFVFVFMYVYVLVFSHWKLLRLWTQLTVPYYYENAIITNGNKYKHGSTISFT